MAAFEPWMSSMDSSSTRSDAFQSGQPPGDPPVYAAFSPTTIASASPKQRSTILVQQKSPLLVATPPQVTRALAYSHPFLQPLNKFVALLSWTSDDPWESFLLLAAFWGTTLYGDVIIRWAGPLVFAVTMMLGMYARRYSPLSSTGWTSASSAKDSTKTHTRKESDGSVRHHKSLDEIVAALQIFTSRCNILLDPFLRLTDFLSTQNTATSATTRPALTAMFLRLLMLSPVWYALTLPPIHLITTRRIILAAGTLVLSWHSRPARVSRTILWRSRFVRRTFSIVTGLSFSKPVSHPSSHPSSSSSNRSANDIAASLIKSRRAGSSKSVSDADGGAPAIRFTFSLYENQRRWIGIGWTSSLLAYERAPWTDDRMNTAQPKETFKLPDVEGGLAKWRWVRGSSWKIDEDDREATHESKTDANAGKKKTRTNDAEDDAGWVYYDNKWLDGRRGQDGWSRYTRRRKWVRDAELVETAADSAETTPVSTPKLSPTLPSPTARSPVAAASADESSGSVRPNGKNRASWFGRKRRGSDSTVVSTAASSTAVDSEVETLEKRDGEDNGYVPLKFRGRQGPLDQEWGVGEELGMELG